MDNRFYPFTEIHPYRPWYHRIRILTLGETALENQERLALRDHILRDITAITLEDTRSLGSMTPATVVGVGVKPVGVDFPGMLETAQTWSKLYSAPTTPNVVPGSSTSQLTEFAGGNKSWDGHQIDQTELEDYVAESKTIKGKVAVTASPLPTVEITPADTSSSLANVESTSPALEPSSPNVECSPIVEPTNVVSSSGSSSRSSSGSGSPSNHSSPSSIKQFMDAADSTQEESGTVDPLFPL
jgi:hypothetical protein